MRINCLLHIIFLPCFAYGVPQSCETFEFVGYYPDVTSSSMIEQHTTVTDQSMAFCSSKCFVNLLCNAMEICDINGNVVCRILGGILTDTESLTLDNCKRFRIVNTCSTGYHDRRLNVCAYGICDFEMINDARCFLEEVSDDDFDWTRLQGATLSIDTGPSAAYSGNYYKYTETSLPRALGDVAVLQSNVPFEARTHCMKLYYHMYGMTMGSLKIKTQNGTATPLTEWEISGDQGNTWLSLDHLNLQLDNQTKIRIEGVRGDNYYSDIGIDDVILLPNVC